jgi:hypothetical protein
MRRVLFTCSILILLTASVSAQKTKPWTEWTAKDADKILNDSAWGQTQTEGDSSSRGAPESAITQTTAARESSVRSTSAAKNVESGEKKDTAMMVYYRVRLLSAKPIRAAFVRLIEIQGAPPEKVAQWRSFVDRDFGDYIVVTITMDGSTDRKRMGTVMAEIGSVNAEALKATTYLERKDGKRVALMEYRAPTDVLGAKFVFPRTLEGKPFIAADSGELRFSTEAGKVLKISKRFKVSEMMYEGKLEY